MSSGQTNNATDSTSSPVTDLSSFNSETAEIPSTSTFQSSISDSSVTVTLSSVPPSATIWSSSSADSSLDGNTRTGSISSGTLSSTVSLATTSSSALTTPATSSEQSNSVSSSVESISSVSEMASTGGSVSVSSSSTTPIVSPSTTIITLPNTTTPSSPSSDSENQSESPSSTTAEVTASSATSQSSPAMSDSNTLTSSTTIPTTVSSDESSGTDSPTLTPTSPPPSSSDVLTSTGTGDSTATESPPAESISSDSSTASLSTESDSSTLPPDSTTITAVTSTTTPSDSTTASSFTSSDTSSPTTDSSTVIATPSPPSSISSSEVLTPSEITSIDDATTTSSFVESTSSISSLTTAPSDSATIPNTTTTPTTISDSTTTIITLSSSLTDSSASVSSTETDSSLLGVSSTDSSTITISSISTSSLVATTLDVTSLTTLSIDSISLLSSLTLEAPSTTAAPETSLLTLNSIASSDSANVVAVVMTASAQASTASGVETLTTLTTEFLTSTLSDGQVTEIPTYTGTVVITVLPTGKVAPNPFLRNKGAIVGVIITGAFIIAAGLLVLIYAVRRRRKRMQLRSRSPEALYSERSGRVLIPGHSPGAASPRPLASQEWRPPLVEEVGDEEGREIDEEEDYPGPGQLLHAPMVVPVVPKEDYGSLMGAVHKFASIPSEGSIPRPASRSIPVPKLASGDPEVVSTSSSRISGLLISFDEDDMTNTPSRSQSDTNLSSEGGSGGWVQADVLTPDPFADPQIDSPFDSMPMIRSETPSTVRYVALSGASSSQLFSSLATPSPLSSSPRLGVQSEAPNRLRGGESSTAALIGDIQSTASLASPFESPFDPYTDSNSSSALGHSSLLNPPRRPKFMGTLTDLIRSSEPPVLPPIEPVASPGESIDSYHADDLLDPTLLESGSSLGGNAEGGRGSHSSESLLDYVDYTRPISSIVFRRPTTLDSQIEHYGEDVPVENSEARLPTSPAVRAYHNKLLGGNGPGSTDAFGRATDS
ncbi:hypothetical protein GYMLUDRAFT_717683 [Collybiopsis luxurians FD-317 M1]|nr:hypothetical protein GYMLUDRAFT_717683 [Collybiopsis luxurians FD-317 M1]